MTELVDLRVPALIFCENCTFLRKATQFSKERILSAIGVDMSCPQKAKVSWL